MYADHSEYFFFWHARPALNDVLRRQNASEKPFLDLEVLADDAAPLLVIALSTDRTMTLYDPASSSTSSASVTFLHPSTPSCISRGTPGSQQVVTGAYDGVVRIWDLRSTKGAIASFKAWDGRKKVLSVDWVRGMIGVGGEGGFEVWKVGESVP